MSVHPDCLRSPEYRLLDNVEHFAAGQFTGTEFEICDAMIELADEWPGAALVTEDFVLDSKVRSEMLLSPVRLNAAFRYEMGRHGRSRRVRVQNRSLAKTTVTDERLKAWGFWERMVGQEHARDAAKHCLTFLKRLKTQPKLRAVVFPAL
jgi:hypothetical protein